MKFTKKIKKELILEVAMFCVGIIAIALFYKNNILLTLILLAAWGLITMLIKRISETFVKIELKKEASLS